MTEQTCVVFKICSQRYCVDILKVKEICMNANTIILPNTPSFIEGIINLRGDVLCIINLAVRLGFKNEIPKDQQQIIVVNVDGNLIGFLVDQVEGILNIPEECFEPTPPIASNCSEFVDGIVKLDNKMIIYLDLEKVLTQKEIDAIEELNKEKDKEQADLKDE